MENSLIGHNVKFIDRQVKGDPEKTGRVLDKYYWPLFDAKSPCTWYLIQVESGHVKHVQANDITYCYTQYPQ